MIQQLAKLYWWSLMFVVGILFLALMIGWWGNISGNVWIPGTLFLLTLFIKAFVADVATFLIKQTAGIIAIPLPIITYDDAVRQVRETLEPRLATIFTFVALAFMLLTTIQINSDFKTQIDVTSLVLFGIVVLAWHGIMTNAPSNIITKLILLVGISLFIRAILVVFAPSIYELTNHTYYPGIRTDRSQVVSMTRAMAERNARISAENDIKTLQNFQDLANKFPAKSTEQVISFIKENYASNSPERAIVDAEERRQENLLQNRAKKSLQGFAGSKLFRKKQVYTIVYYPQANGVGGMNVSVPFAENGYTIQCEGRYTQLFADGTASIGCGGYNRRPILRVEYLNRMPIQDTGIYGHLIVDNVLPRSGVYHKSIINININIPQRTESYVDITGGLTISFHEQ